MKDRSGAIRTSIQGQGGGVIAGAGERSIERGCSGHWRCRADAAARLEAVITTAALDEAGKSDISVALHLVLW